MTADPEADDALTWAGDDPQVAEALKPVAEPLGASPQPIPAMLLVTYGVLAGIFLVYTAGWIAVVVTSGYTAPDLLGELMWQFGEFLAIASPALWFATVMLLTRGRKPLARLLLLVLGLVVVLPWPFLIGGIA